MAVSLAPVFARPVIGEQQKGIKFAGINLAGAEFGDRIPGIYGRDYLYPRVRSIDYFRGLGFNLVRLPFRWERLQPDLGGAFKPEEEKHLRGLADHIARLKASVILDPHNYARRRLSTDGWQQQYLIGSRQVPESSFVDFWVRLASLFRGNANVIFGLMNEPFDIPATDWLRIANAAIAGIRNAGAANLILVPGVAYSGAHSWIVAGNGAMSGISDPARNVAFDVHQYFDDDSSGTHPQVVSTTIGSERIRDFENWAREHSVKAFLGEFGAGEDEASCLAIKDLCRSLSASPDVWLGWAAWAAGPMWPRDYMFNLEPDRGRERPQTKILASFAKQAGG